MFFKRKNVHVYYEDGNRPLARFTNGAIVTTVWLNRTSKGHAMMMSFSRISDGKEIKAFYAKDMRDIERGAKRAIRRMNRGVKIHS